MSYTATSVTADRETIINTFVTNLDDKRYGNRFCIIQELIQNADDAKAEHLLMGYGKLENAPHPLFKEEGIFFINDGKLSQSDREHLFKVATSNKAADKKKIGHFGLGMKSVFHFCEAFFMFWKQPENQKELGQDADFLDPWYDAQDINATPERRQIWHNDFCENAETLSQAIREYFQTILKGWKRWFCIWLPLRKSWMFDSTCPPFKSDCFTILDAKKILNAEYVPEISEMLPFMKCLSTIQFFNDSKQLVDEINVEAQRRLQLNNGSINLQIKSRNSLPYLVSGKEKLERQDDSNFKKMMDDSSWPRSTKRGPDGTFLPEKVIPHTAMCWMRQDHANKSSNGRFKVQHCVFLPLTSEKQKYEANLEAPFDVTFSLHATFFVDAGRQDFSALSDPSGGITKYWNYCLLCQSLLPQVIESLEKATENWSHQDITVTVKAFSNFLLNHDENCDIKYLGFIAQKYQFLQCLDKGTWKWLKKSNSQNYLEIPHSTIPALLNTLSQKLNVQDLQLVSAATPGITNNKSLGKRTDGRDGMDDDVFRRLRQMIKNLPPATLFSVYFISWFYELLSLYPLDKEQQSILLKAFLKEITPEKYQDNQKSIVKLLIRFSQTVQLIELKKTNWGKAFGLWKKLAACDDTTMVPMIFSLDEAELMAGLNEYESQAIKELKKNQFPKTDLEVMLPIIARQSAEDINDDAKRALSRNMVFTLFQNCPEAQFDEKLCDYRVFTMKKQDGAWDRLSLNQIQDPQLPIFLSGGEGTKIRMINNAAKIHYWIFQDTGELYTNFLKQWLKVFSFSHVKRFFPANDLPELNPVQNRVEFFEELVKGSDIKANSNIARYLLLGDKEKYNDETELYLLPTNNFSMSKVAKSFWDTMLHYFFEVTGTSQTSLPNELVDKLTETAKLALNIKLLDCNGIIKQLETVEHFENLCVKLKLNSDTWKHLINNINLDDKVCCKVAMRLPVYPIQDDKYSPLDSNVYFDTRKIRIPDLFLNKVNRCCVPFEKLQKLYELTVIGEKDVVWTNERSLQYCMENSDNYPADELAVVAFNALFEILTPKPADHDFSDELKKYLKEQKALPLQSGKLVSASEIVQLVFDDDSKKIANSVGIYSVEQLDTSRISGQILDWLKANLFPQPVDYPRILGLALSKSKHPDYCMGCLKISPELLNNILVDDLAASILPAVRFVRSFREQFEKLNITSENDFKQYFQELAIKIPEQRLLELYNRFADASSDGNSFFYLRYLELLAKCPGFSSKILPNIKLFNAKNQKSKAERLIHSGFNIAPEQLLHPSSRRIIRGTDNPNLTEQDGFKPGFGTCNNLDQKTWEDKVKAAPSQMQDYFDGWGDEYSCHIATLLMLCSDSKAILDYAKSKWDRDVGTVRKLITSPNKDVDTMKKWDGLNLFVNIASDKEYHANNLLGQKVSFKVSNISDMNNLLLGGNGWSCSYRSFAVVGDREKKTKSMYLCLRKLSEADRRELGKEKLLKLLQNTVNEVVRQLIDGNEDSTAQLWDFINKNELLDLEIVQKIILDYLPSYLPSLGISRGLLHKNIAKLHELHRAVVQAEHSGQDSEDKLQKIQEVKKSLQNVVSQNKDAQQDILQAVIKKITQHCGYDFNSIPFELFQNADDAVAEMPIAKRRRINCDEMILALSNDDLSVMHFGRPINKNLSNNVEDVNSQGCQDDLEKMLLLWRSDKEIGDLKRTGKFGLGFKSVYQLTDEPLIASGALKFAIKGTIFPVEPESILLEKKKNDLEQYSQLEGVHSIPTVMVFPLRQGVIAKGYLDKKTEKEENAICLKKYIDSADLLLIFSHGIKKMTIVDKGITHRYSVEMQREENGFSIYSTGQDNYYAVIKLPETNVLVALGYDTTKESPKPIDDKFATLWITEPTQVYNKLGFAVNGNFAIDIGRNSLIPTNDDNSKLATMAGNELYKFLRKQQNEKPFSDGWLEALWECFTGGEQCTQWNNKAELGVGKFLPEIIWGKASQRNGYGKFLEEVAGIPTRCPLSDKKFVKLKDCKEYCSDELASSENWQLFEPFEFSKHHSIVSEKVYNCLNMIYFPIQQMTQLSAISIVEQWVSGKEILIPGQLMNKQWSKIIQFCEKEQDRKTDFDKIFKNIKLLNKSRIAAKMTALVSEKLHQDDPILCSFAPDEALIAEEYFKNEDVACLLRHIYHGVDISAETIVEWIYQADSEVQSTSDTDNPKVDAIAKYLVSGKYSLEVALKIDLLRIENDLIKKAVNARMEIQKPAASQENDSSKKIEVLLNSPNTSLVDEADIFGEGPDVAIKLEKSDEAWLVENWNTFIDEIVNKYNRDNYGSSALPKYSRSTELNDTNNRRQWMELFILAMCRTIGRQKDIQHFGFIKQCRDNGWMDVFSAPDKPFDEKAKDWMSLLDARFENKSKNEQYQHWLKLFPWIYLFNKHLQKYVEIFEKMNRTSFVPKSLDDIVSPGRSDLWSGAGVHLPPLSWGLGKIGPHWLLRELVRANFLTNKALFKYCFVPSTSVKRLFGNQVITSEEISKRWDGETFGKNFDLAFKALDKRYDYE